MDAYAAKDGLGTPKVDQSPLLRRFAHDHLQEPLRSLSAMYYTMAEEACKRHQGDPHLEDLLDKLWEARNLDVLMAALPH